MPENLSQHQFEPSVQESYDSARAGHQEQRALGCASPASRIWLFVTWLDGTRERIEEDYPPWIFVAELSDGHLSWGENGQEQDFDVEWLSGRERERAWRDFGIHEEVEAYM